MTEKISNELYIMKAEVERLSNNIFLNVKGICDEKNGLEAEKQNLFEDFIKNMKELDNLCQNIEVTNMVINKLDEILTDDMDEANLSDLKIKTVNNILNSSITDLKIRAVKQTPNPELFYKQ